MLVGETDCDPDVATEPMPGPIHKLVTFVDDQVSVDDPSGQIVLGEADNVTVGGGITVTVTVSVTVPQLFVAVIV